MQTKINKLREAKVKIIVKCINCNTKIIESIALSKKYAEEMLPKLNITSMFNAPKCEKCKNLEPYNDITLNHELLIVNA